VDCVVCGGLSCGLCSSCGASIKFARHPRERGENKTIFALLAYMLYVWPVAWLLAMAGCWSCI